MSSLSQWRVSTPIDFVNLLINWLASVSPTKKNTWFELFFVPIIPLSRKHILLCMICGWQAALIDYKSVHWSGSWTSLYLYLWNHSQAPAIAVVNKPSQPHGAQDWDAPNQTGYQPAYISRPQKWSASNSTLWIIEYSFFTFAALFIKPLKEARTVHGMAMSIPAWDSQVQGETILDYCK